MPRQPIGPPLSPVPPGAHPKGGRRSHIDSPTNPLVKRMRRLRDKSHRREEGLFLAEGLRIITEARECGTVPRWLFVGGAGAGAAHPLAEAAAQAVLAAGGEVVTTTPAVLAKLSGKDNPQTVIGIYDQFDTALDRVDRTRAPIWLVAQAMRDPGNLGTMLRTGDAVGAGGLILLDACTDPFSVEAVRASMGALFTQQIAMASGDAFLAWLRAGPGQLVATHLDAAVDYRAPDYAAPCFVMVGNESQGLPADYAAAADVRVKIPMLGRADSLNAAVAGALVAYAALDSQRRGGPA